MASITKRKNKWLVQIRKKNIPPLAKSFISKHDAVRWARESEIKIERGLFGNLEEANTTTLAQLLERYLLEVSPKKKSHINESYKIRKLMRMPISENTLARLTSTKIAKFRESFALDVKPSTVNKYLTYIQVAINHARREWDLYLPINPVESIKRLPEPEPSTERVFGWEYDMLVKNAEKSKLKCLKSLIIVAYESGARRGELFRLLRSDVKVERKVAHLRDTKNGTNRWIGLSDDAMKALLELPPTISGRYFETSLDQFKFYWNQLKRWTGYKKRFHTFRAEFATRCFENGWDVSMVATQGGWKDWKVLRRYSRISGDALANKFSEKNVQNLF